jgi:DNA-binding transcriptional regulator YiaG
MRENSGFYVEIDGIPTPLVEALKLSAPLARKAIAAAVEEGVHYENPLVFSAVRRGLNLSQTDLAQLLGFAGDPSSTGRTIRRWEQVDGPGPTQVAAYALRWLAQERGLLKRRQDP